MARAQSSETPPAPVASPQPQQQPSPEPTQPRGKVLFSRDQNSTPAATQPDAQEAPETAQDDPLKVTDTERSALTFTAYDLDVHLTPASAGISVRAGLTLRNDGAAPLSRLVLQITSSMHWEAFSTRGNSRAAGEEGSTTVQPLSFVSRPIDTDTDHTGSVAEAVITLPEPLAPGGSMPLTALYSGTIAPSANRLVRLGGPVDQSLLSDWDAISTGETALRGFGYVTWYPVAAAPVFLGDGTKLFQEVGSAKLRASAATIRLRLATEYVGDPPDAAYFCGRRGQLVAISDNPNLPEAESPGIATVSFEPERLGFRTPDLFITNAAPNDTGTAANPDLIEAVTDHEDTLPAYSGAAALVEPLLTDWLGNRPQTPLTILDHAGQPYEDDALLVRPLRASEPAALAPSLAHSLTHAWIHSDRAWIDEGLAQFISLLWTERTAGKAAALAELEDAASSFAVAEPSLPASAASRDSSSSSGEPAADASNLPAGSIGQSLIAATSDAFYRSKAAAVWWILRAIVGDDALKQALQTYRSNPKLDRDPTGIEHAIEESSHKPLRWFFDDWVYRDRGLPDLSIVSVTPSQVDSHAGLPAGWLVAVDVHNDGYAAAEVAVTVRSSSATETQSLVIPGRSSSSMRIVFAGTPEQVQVNDGSVPEIQTSIHTRQLVLPRH
jgi:hypothetical protein